MIKIKDNIESNYEKGYIVSRRSILGIALIFYGSSSNLFVIKCLFNKNFLFFYNFFFNENTLLSVSFVSENT